MRTKNLLILLFSVLVITGCSSNLVHRKQVFAPEPFPAITETFTENAEVFDKTQYKGSVAGALGLGVPFPPLAGLGLVGGGMYEMIRQFSDSSKYFIEPASAEYADEINKIYSEYLKKELVEAGFTVLEKPADGSLVIKTKIGNLRHSMSLGTGGYIKAYVEIYRDDTLLMSFEIKDVAFSDLTLTPKYAIRKYIAPEIAKELKKDFVKDPDK
ncbi:hypothetical protein A2999_00395 [Candidatus Wolfebacteria bacterium RIFCSPLOWO2_01_FULL_38_11]|uniref:Uncharacterized protein n=1 Tax=Candidatus Wolfebacteria bacterium RIFCSPLOWO2_01_FULL_38_11 TaxID=1802556 RepID=A0A1F8DP61_9BACT|nr:MAG: hypothetical protein A2999_00395 [Candidatus Wolfebacteria bacterium RIFCSPLOWO2_01_FULL_38_11]